MKAIILAAGKATRLLPLTKDIPQCLLRVNNKTILEKQVKYLKKAGINEITVITGYLSNKVEEFCKNFRIKTLFNPFYEVSGMALTLWVAKEELKKGFVFLYSDLLVDPKVIEGLLENKGNICLAIKKDGIREEAEKVVEKEGCIVSVKKAKTGGENGEFVGVAKFSERGAEILINELNEMAKINIDSSFINVIERIIDKGERVDAYDIKDLEFIDIDFPEDLKKTEKLFT